MKFANRTEAGKILAEHLQTRSLGTSPVVLALPRGGIPVGYEVARRLSVPLDVFVVRKLGFPGNEEFAMGAIASGGTIVLDDAVISTAKVPREVVDSVIAKEQRELERRERAYRDGRQSTPLEGRDVILVDDGLATGQTMRAAVRALRKVHPRSITVAVPVGAEDTCNLLAREADTVICATTPDPFYAVGMWYDDFTQTTDEQVREWLRLAFSQQSSDDSAASPAARGPGEILLQCGREYLD